MSETSPVPVAGPVEALWDLVVGQDRAVASLRAAIDRPVHAYLLVGPRGSGRRAAARAFAAGLLSQGQDEVAQERTARLMGTETHPDLTVVERTGPYITRDQARSVVERSALTPVESGVKVLLLTEFHLVLDAAPILLKAIEEPPEGTYFVVIADDVPADLVTIASRCVRIDFSPVPEQAVIDRLVQEGIAPDVAADVARASGGDLGRARLLATDEGLAARVATWRQIPARLDGVGSTVAAVVDEIIAMIDLAQEPIDRVHAGEIAEIEQRIKDYGERGSGKKALDDRHRREKRRLRADELRFGLGLLSEAYRDRLVAGAGRGPGHGVPGGGVTAIAEIYRAVDAIERNVGERLMLHALLVKLHPLG